MVIAHHVIFSAYGFWLPNDPRGSGSSEVRAANLQPFGEATLVSHRQSVAGISHDYQLRKMAKEALKYPHVIFDDAQVQAIGDGFAAQVEKSKYVVHACCIQSDHSHLVIKQHHYDIEQVGRLLKQAATTMLDQRGQNPMRQYKLKGNKSPSPWGQDFWKVFLFTDEDVMRCVRYVEENPLKAGRPRQVWPFVTQYPNAGSS